MLKGTKVIDFIEKYDKLILSDYELLKENIDDLNISFIDFKKMCLLVKSRLYQLEIN